MLWFLDTLSTGDLDPPILLGFPYLIVVSLQLNEPLSVLPIRPIYGGRTE